MKLKLHDIFLGKYKYYWLAISILVALKIIIFGLHDNGFTKMYGYEKRSIIFWIVSVLVCSFIYAIPFYLIYRLISRKWDNDVFMMLIILFAFLLLIFLV